MDAEYQEIAMNFDRYPGTLIVPVADQIKQIYSLFEYSPEYIIDQAVEACMCRASAFRNIANFAHRLANDLERLEEIHRGDDYKWVTEWRNPDVFLKHSDRLITIEQATMEMQREFVNYKLYMEGGYLPYRFEHVLHDGSLVLKKCQDYEEFFDRLSFIQQPSQPYLR